MVKMAHRGGPTIFEGEDSEKKVEEQAADILISAHNNASSSFLLRGFLTGCLISQTQ
jgi:hypothetical protein